MSKLLQEKAILEGIKRINNLGPPLWSLHTINQAPLSQVLRAHYQLKSFKRSWEFLNVIAKQANLMKHHPTIITTYNKIDIELTTHDLENNISQLDIDLAQKIHQEYSENFS